METQMTRFMLLQLNDSQFPIGGYSHSYGLETYVQRGIVHDAKTAEEYIRRRLRYNVLYTDLLTVRLAYCLAQQQDGAGLDRLETLLEASRLPQEIRDGSRRLGRRFVKTLDKMEISWQNGFYLDFFSRRKSEPVCYPCAYGVACACAGLPERDTLACFLYAQTAAMVTNSVKLIPLSQSDGQRMLSGMYPLFEELLQQVETAGEEMLCASTPAFDLRSMQHETLYSRLYMS